MISYHLCNFLSDSVKEACNSTLALIKFEMYPRLLNLVSFSNNGVSPTKYESTMNNLIDNYLIQYHLNQL